MMSEFERDVFETVLEAEDGRPVPIGSVVFGFLVELSEYERERQRSATFAQVRAVFEKYDGTFGVLIRRAPWAFQVSDRAKLIEEITGG